MRFFSHGDVGAQEPADFGFFFFSAAARLQLRQSPSPSPAASRNALVPQPDPDEGLDAGPGPPALAVVRGLRGCSSNAAVLRRCPIAAKRRLELGGGGAGGRLDPHERGAENTSSSSAAAAAAAAALPHYLPPRSHPLPALLPQFAWGGTGLTSAMWADQAAPAVAVEKEAGERKKVAAAPPNGTFFRGGSDSSASDLFSASFSLVAVLLLFVRSDHRSSAVCSGRALNSRSNSFGGDLAEAAEVRLTTATTDDGSGSGSGSGRRKRRRQRRRRRWRQQVRRRGARRNRKRPAEHEIAGSDVPLSAVPLDWRPDRDDVAWCYEEVDGDEN